MRSSLIASVVDAITFAAYNPMLAGGDPFDNDDGIKGVTVFTKTVTLLFPFVVDRKCALRTVVHVLGHLAACQVSLDVTNHDPLCVMCGVYCIQLYGETSFARPIP